MNVLKRIMSGGLCTIAVIAGCAKSDEPLALKRERDRLSYKVTDLQTQLDQANAEIARLKGSQK